MQEAALRPRRRRSPNRLCKARSEYPHISRVRSRVVWLRFRNASFRALLSLCTVQCCVMSMYRGEITICREFVRAPKSCTCFDEHYFLTFLPRECICTLSDALVLITARRGALQFASTNIRIQHDANERCVSRESVSVRPCNLRARHRFRRDRPTRPRNAILLPCWRMGRLEMGPQQASASRITHSKPTSTFRTCLLTKIKYNIRLAMTAKKLTVGIVPSNLWIRRPRER